MKFSAGSADEARMVLDDGQELVFDHSELQQAISVPPAGLEAA
jgi:hypothetical protein